MSSELRISAKAIVNKHSGSCFDTTNTGGLVKVCGSCVSSRSLVASQRGCAQVRPGGHQSLPSKVSRGLIVHKSQRIHLAVTITRATQMLEPSAFSLHKQTARPEKNNFLRKGTGTGGMLVRLRWGDDMPRPGRLLRRSVWRLRLLLLRSSPPLLPRSLRGMPRRQNTCSTKRHS